MSQEQAAEIKEHAQEIFGIFAEKLDHSHWDWHPVAEKAFEAAEAFYAMYKERYAPQSATPSGILKAGTVDLSSGAVVDPTVTGNVPGEPVEKPSSPPSESPTATSTDTAATATGPAPEPEAPAPDQPQHPSVTGGVGRVAPSQ
jgi:hypothetical protein